MPSTTGRIAFLGLGRMGLPMARRLVDAGYELRGFDVGPGAVAAARDAGLQVCDSLAEATAPSELIVTMLPDPPAVQAAAHGDDGVLSALAPGALWLEMTSSHPDVTREVAAAAATRSAVLLDAPVSGGVAGARDGTLTVACAGPPEALDATRPVLDVLASRIVHVSDRPGDGDLSKTINNLLSAANLTIAAEGLALALSAGLDPARLVEYVSGSSGSSNAIEAKIPRYVLTGSFDAGFTIGQYVKDLQIALDVAGGEDLELPLAAQAGELWMSFAQGGHAADDHTQLVRLLAERLGVAWDPVPPADG